MEMTAAQKADMARQVMGHNMKFNKQKLIETARWLAADLNRLAEELEKEEPLYNSLGVVQGRGSEVDRLCGELKQQMEIDKMLKYIAE